MSVNKFNDALTRHLQENFWLYAVSILFICIGIVLGVRTVLLMGQLDKKDLLSYFSSFAEKFAGDSINHNSIFIETMKNNILIMFCLWLFGLTIIGVPFILLIDAIKGFTLGFTIAFFINGVGIKGMWLSLLSVCPQNMIYLPCIIISSVLAMHLSITALRSKFSYKGMRNDFMNLGTYSFSFVLILLLMFVGFFLESYLTPNLVRIVVINSGCVIL